MKYSNFASVAFVLAVMTMTGCQDTPVLQPVQEEKLTGSERFSLAKGTATSVDAEHFLVDFSASTERLSEAVTALGGVVEQAHPEIGVAKVSGLNDEQAAQLSAVEGVGRVTRDIEVQWVPANIMDAGIEIESVEADALVDPETHNNPANATRFALWQWNMRQVQAQSAWTVEQGKPVVRVGIYDTGISPTHQDLVGRYDLAASRNFTSANLNDFIDRNFHGTLVSGIISTNNRVVAGIAPHVRLVGIKVLRDNGSGSFANIISAIIYGADVARLDIINMSFGAYFPKSARGGGPLNAALAKAINYANSKGVLVVASAGNGGTNLDKDKNFVHVPSQSGTAFSVSATGPFRQQNFDELAFYSNYGVSGVDVAAPGGARRTGGFTDDGIAGPLPPALVGGAINFYVRGVNGTSFSAPLVAGIAALVDSKFNGTLNGGELRAKMKQTTDDLGKPGTDLIYSHGRVNAYRSVTE